MKGLTEKQEEILEYIEKCMAQHGMSPTVNEIAEYFGIKASSSFAHLKALQKKGYVNRSSKARSLELAHSANSSASASHLSLALSIPLLGRISASQPLMSEEHVEKTIQFDPSGLPRSAGGKELFALQVNGESMRDMGILDGDTIIAQVQNNPRIGDIVVANIDGDTTVKSFYIHENQVELRPANDEFQPMYFPLEAVSVQGVVVALQRTF